MQLSRRYVITPVAENVKRLVEFEEYQALLEKQHETESDMLKDIISWLPERDGKRDPFGGDGGRDLGGFFKRQGW